ncbi:hypothetical protein WA026_007171 [Henosepilachna vigintioctopunctata]|uniref:T-box domain-containing protein n=1 Tax=Henosepilachna vigintioctopunctata TaxID=420089 RepID=A0AAW1V9J5_9CUCU
MFIRRPFTHSCNVTLQHKELWEKFHELGTEMVITKSGRRMFPSIHVEVTGLDPKAQYCVFLEMIPVSNSRYRYVPESGWSRAGNEIIECPPAFYIHPESPSSGEMWMSQPISFGRVKLTNVANSPAGYIHLNSMHKYQPKIVIVQSSDPRYTAWAASTTVTFPETAFIAVTAYQNERVTKLKIDNNPFAKGFRENGQSKCKKRKIEEEVIDILTNDDDKSENTHVCRLHGCDSPTSSNEFNSDSPPRIADVLPQPSYAPYYFGYPYPYFHDRWNSQLIMPPLYPPVMPPVVKTNNEQFPRPKKLTDFSINAIMRNL